MTCAEKLCLYPHTDDAAGLLRTAINLNLLSDDWDAGVAASCPGCRLCRRNLLARGSPNLGPIVLASRPAAPFP